MRPVLIPLLLVLLGVELGAQSLGDAARREREKRTRRPPANAKVYTDDDLKKPDEPGGEKKASRESASRETSAVSASQESSASETGEGSSAGREMVWRQGARQRRDAIASAEARISEIESRLGALMNDRDPVGLMDPSRLQTIEARKAAARQELEQAKAALAEARNALADFQEQARRQGIPPGWLR
jgi:hypothetical protein